MIRIASFPYAAGTNPYLALYYRALEPYGITTTLDAKLEDRFIREHRNEFDVLHLHWTHESLWRRPGGLLSRLRGLAGAVKFLRLVKTLGKPIVWTVHDLEPLDSGGMMDRIGNTLVAKYSDLMICHTEATRDRLVGKYWGDAKKTVVMPIGNYDGVFPLSKPREETLAELGLEPSKRTLVAAGVVRAYKGYDVALRALPLLGPEYQLVIAGEVYRGQPEVGKELKTLAANLPNVRLVLRSLSDAELANYYGAANCVLLPYRQITGSAALLTALTLSRGVVATDLPFFKEILAASAEAGVVVSVNDPAALAAGVKEFFNTDVTARHAAARQLADKLAWPEVVKPVAERLLALKLGGTR